MGVRLSVTPRDAASSDDGALYEFEQDRILLGRGAGADVALPHRSVSVRHATIEQRKGSYVIVDHGSTNGTRVNGAKLVPERPKPLRDGDRIDVGAFVLGWKEGVPVVASPSAERTASLARRLLRDVLGDRAPSGARLTVTNGASAGAALEIPAPPARLVIGRGETCDLPLADADASREHVDLVVDLDGVIARDRGSKNGLLVNGRAVPEKRLADRDELLIGATLLVYEDLGEGALRSAAEGADEPIADPTPPPAPPPVPAAPADDPDAPTGEPEPPKEPAPRTSPAAPSTSRLASAELVIYALAALVFLASVAGLWWLVRAE